MREIVTHCPHCGTEIEEPEEHDIVTCPICCLPKSTFCCAPAGRGCRCTECEETLRNDESRPNPPSIDTLFKSYCKTYSLSPRKRTPAEAFEGNCFPVAHELAHLLGSPARHIRGHWVGPDYREERSYRTIQQHSWVEMGDWWLDPTRFVFEDARPYIYVCPAGEDSFYDPLSLRVNGRDSSESLKLPPRDGALIRSGLSLTARRVLMTTFNDGRDFKKWTNAERIRIANTNPAFLGGSALEILGAVLKIDPGYVPIDTVEYLFPEEVHNPRKMVKR